MLGLLSLYLLLAFHFMPGYGTIQPLNYEAHLRNMLFSNWTDIDMESMPGKISTGVVKFGINVTHVKHLDDFKGILSINAILMLQWENPHLKWYKLIYGGIESITLGVDYMWHPDIHLYNSVSGVDLLAHGPTLARVWHNGTVDWYPQVTLKMYCALNVRHFPFDQQSCTFKFGSWTKDGFSMDVKTHPAMQTEVIIQDYQKHFNEWEVIKSSLVREAVYYACCPEPYIDMKFTIDLDRHSSFYWHTLLAPLLVTMAITLTMFWLPPSAGEKFLLAGVNLTVLIILLNQLYWVVPRNPTVPILVAVTGCVYFFMALSLVISAATSALAYRNDAIPAILDRYLKGRLGTTLCLPAASFQVADAADQGMTGDWNLVAVAINRIAFMFYVIAMIILFVLTVA